MEGVVKVGEVRRVHIIYLLSRMGRIEHPHLLRAHHLTRNGVYLRDVKRWLAQVRSQDFPEAFSWSYKRRYKNGYLWQDLLDDDLITPISDNEYVLKGSQYHNQAGSYNHHEKTTCVLRNDVEEQPSLQSQMESEILALKLNTSSEIGQHDSPLFNRSDTSTLTHDSTKHTSKQTTSEQNEYNHSSSSFYSNLTKDGNQQENNKNGMEKTATSSDSSFSSSSSYISPNSSQSKTKTTYSNGTSSKPRMFRNWITCGGVDTNDAVLVTINWEGLAGFLEVLGINNIINNTEQPGGALMGRGVVQRKSSTNLVAQNRLLMFISQWADLLARNAGSRLSQKNYTHT
ncbi:hypothetical protein LWI28_021867 [Acer negundo]|uniref:SOSEKI DIX-like domain-containing protein n=1 Tax=Acer negundo TaxID=4023 RepID=A0AAD5NM84_ACENE|nr:hypothetical protein LWI28_021867 [Acer negundo]